MHEELHPYVLCRVAGDQAECAVWQIEGGQKALAFFLSGDTATSYRGAAQLGPDWRVFRPARDALLHLLKASFAAGILFAVLDPDRDKAKRIFDIQEILKAVEP